MPAIAGSAERPFLCLTTKPGGGRSVLVRTAATPGQLASALRKERLTVLHSVALPKAFTPEKGLKLADQAVLNEQLYALLSRGVPLVEALEVVAGTVTPVARPVVRHMREAVASGTSFSDACDKTGVFDAVTIAVYRAAERTGDLAGAARQLAISMRRTIVVTGKAQSLLIYPLVLLVVSVVVSFVLLVGVLPSIGERLTELQDIRLPVYSQVLFAVGIFLRANILPVVLILGVAIGLCVVLRKAIIASTLRAARSLPLVRDVMLASESARFFTVMSAMSKAGVPLADGLATANLVIGHPKLRKQLDNLRSKLVAGGLLRQLIEQVEALPLATRRLLLAAERSGDLDSAFGSLAQDMTDEVERQSSRLLAFLQPLLIVIMATLVGGLLMAILIPILTLSSNISSS
jgi:type II secretory pathway component PulF